MAHRRCRTNQRKWVQPMSEHPRLGFFLYSEPWANALEEGRVKSFIEYAYNEISLVTDERRRAAYHVVMSANGVTTVVLGMN